MDLERTNDGGDILITWASDRHSNRNMQNENNNHPGALAMKRVMDIPEILALVLSFLNRPALISASKVSPQWRQWSLPLLWTQYTTSEALLQQFFQPSNDHADSTTHVQATVARNVSFIRSLTVQSVPRRTLAPISDIPDHTQLLPGLRNLTYLELGTWDKTLATKIVDANIKLEELLLHDYDRYPRSTPLNFGLFTNIPRLRKLVFSGPLGFARIVAALLDISPDFIVEDQSSFTLQSLAGEGIMDKTLDGRCRPVEPFLSRTLEELVLIAPPPYDEGIQMFGTLRWNTLPGQFFFIRSLSLVNFGFFTAEDDGTEPEDWMNQILLTFLKKFPLLESLRICWSKDELFRPQAKTFRERTVEAYGELQEDDLWIVQEGFGLELVKICPRIRSLDLGMWHAFTDLILRELMMVYGKQLESFRAYGLYVGHKQETSDLMSRFVERTWQTLTVLDLSDVWYLEEVGWQFLARLKKLKEFRALGVKMDGNTLVGFDWACTEIEILGLNVMIPGEDIPKFVAWKYEEFMALRGLEGEVGGGGDLMNEKQKKKKEKGKKSKKERKDKKERKKKSADKKKEKQKQDLEEDTSDAEATFAKPGYRHGSESLSLGSLETTPEPSGQLSKRGRRLKYGDMVQVEICRQLGRLTKLKELTLEGKQDMIYNRVPWNCLRLTLETGLQELKPLGANLETLVLYQLEEDLCGGREEMEWVARNWVHCDRDRHRRKKAWVESKTGDRDKNQGEGEEEEGEVHQEIPEVFSPCPKFRRLIGVSVRSKDGQRASALERNLNVAWLREECPCLEVEVDLSKSRDDFSFGRFEDY